MDLKSVYFSQSIMVKLMQHIIYQFKQLWTGSLLSHINQLSITLSTSHSIRILALQGLEMQNSTCVLAYFSKIYPITMQLPSNFWRKKHLEYTDLNSWHHNMQQHDVHIKHVKITRLQKHNVRVSTPHFWGVAYKWGGSQWKSTLNFPDQYFRNLSCYFWLYKNGIRTNHRTFPALQTACIKTSGVGVQRD